MASTDPLRDLVERIAALLPAGGLALPDAYREELRALLQGCLLGGSGLPGMPSTPRWQCCIAPRPALLHSKRA